MSSALWTPLGHLYSAIPGPGVATNFSLNQATDQLEFLFQWPSGYGSDPLTRLGFRQGTLTGVAPVYRVSLQGGVDGLPDAAVKTGAFVDYTPTVGNNSTFQWLNLGASYQPSAGEWLAMVIAYQSGTIDGSNFSSFASNLAQGFLLEPYAIQNDNGSRTKQTSAPIFGYGSATVPFGNPALNFNNISYNSGSTPDEYAFRFNLPSGWGSTYKVAGFRWMVATGSAAHVIRVTLYDGTTALQSVDVDTDFIANFSNRNVQVLFDEASLSTLNFGSTYRIGLAPQDATNQNVVYHEVSANADFDAYPPGPGAGKELYYSSRVDAGAWTDVTTRRLYGELLLADITGASGSIEVSIVNAMQNDRYSGVPY